MRWVPAATVHENVGQIAEFARPTAQIARFALHFQVSGTRITEEVNNNLVTWKNRDYP